MTESPQSGGSGEWRQGDNAFDWPHSYVGIANHGPCNVEIAFSNDEPIRCLRPIDHPIHNSIPRELPSQRPTTIEIKQLLRIDIKPDEILLVELSKGTTVEVRNEICKNLDMFFQEHKLHFPTLVSIEGEVTFKAIKISDTKRRKPI